MSADTVLDIKKIESTISDNWIVAIIIAVIVFFFIFLLIFLKKKKKQKKVEEVTDLPETHTTIPIEQTYVAAEPVNLPESETPPINEDIPTSDTITEPEIINQTDIVAPIIEQPTEPVSDNLNTPLEATTSITELTTEKIPEVPVIPKSEDPLTEMSEISYHAVENNSDSSTETEDSSVISTMDPDNSQM